MPQIFDYAELVEQMANNLIPQYHPELAGARIKYVFQEKASKKGGKIVYGSAKKLSGLTEFLVQADFLVTVAADEWRQMPQETRLALVDHLLERCFGEEDEENGGAMKWKTREPDVHEFGTILSRHGQWNEGLQNFLSVAGAINVDAEAGEVETVG